MYVGVQQYAKQRPDSRAAASADRSLRRGVLDTVDKEALTPTSGVDPAPDRDRRAGVDPSQNSPPTARRDLAMTVLFEQESLRALRQVGEGVQIQRVILETNRPQVRIFLMMTL